MVNSDLYTHAAGTRVAPTTTADLAWTNNWITPNRTRHWDHGTPLFYWFEAVFDALNDPRMGNPLSSSTRSSLSWLTKEANFDAYTEFIIESGNQFETAVVNYMRNNLSSTTFRNISTSGGLDARLESKVAETCQAMDDGIHIITQGVLWQPDERFYGSPDILVRSDKLVEILQELNDSSWTPQSFGGNLSEAAPNLTMEDGESYHYRVIDVKSSTLYLAANGHNMTSKHSGHSIQLAMYNSALEKIQGLDIPEGYILGRCAKWSGANAGRTDQAFGKLGIANLQSGNNSLIKARSARDFNTRMRTQSWDALGNLILSPLPSPSDRLLYPNMKNDKSFPWKAARNYVAEQLNELTVAPSLGVESRNKLIDGLDKDGSPITPVAGWRAPSLPGLILTDKIKGIGPKTKDYISTVVTVNQSSSATTNPTPSTQISNIPSANVEFFVDFETVNNQGDKFQTPSQGGVFPRVGGQALIYMIGCGHEDPQTGDWVFQEFVTTLLTIEEEERIILEWLDYMDTTATAIASAKGCAVGTPNVYHWTGAEKTNMTQASARRIERDATKSAYPSIDWNDLNAFVVSSLFAVKGSWRHSLKPFINAMNSHFGNYDPSTGDGIDRWPSGSTVDGQGAMVAAWEADDWARISSNPTDMNQAPLMPDAVAYNEADCKVMWQLLKHIRKNHS